MAQLDLTKGKITKTMLLFALPMIFGNLLQQLYNVVDTLIVGQFLGSDALAAVGSSFTLMTFLTSILLGLSMGSGAIIAIRYGENNRAQMSADIAASFLMTAVFTLVINIAVFVFLDEILLLLSVPESVVGMMRAYLEVIFWGIAATFLYNYFACLLRAVGNSLIPLVFLGISAAANIVLDLVFVLVLDWGVGGAAFATILAQGFSGLGILIYTLCRCPWLLPKKADWRPSKSALKEVASASVLTCLQQSVMNLGILMVQSLVNSFGAAVMAAFAAAVKIDSFAYMPLQDFGNAFSTFIAQNYGAKQNERIVQGIRSAVRSAVVFALLVSFIVVVFAKPLLLIFIQPKETEIIAIGIGYLRIVGLFYFGIGGLFLLYGYFRAVNRPGISLFLTMISLGSRVVLAYSLSSLEPIGVTGIWWAVPIGWFLADTAGVLAYAQMKKRPKANKLGLA